MYINLVEREIVTISGIGPFYKKIQVSLKGIIEVNYGPTYVSGGADGRWFNTSVLVIGPGFEIVIAKFTSVDEDRTGSFYDARKLASDLARALDADLFLYKDADGSKSKESYSILADER